MQPLFMGISMFDVIRDMTGTVIGIVVLAVMVFKTNTFPPEVRRQAFFFFLKISLVVTYSPMILNKCLDSMDEWMLSVVLMHPDSWYYLKTLIWVVGPAVVTGLYIFFVNPGCVHQHHNHHNEWRTLAPVHVI